ncbi:MAG: indole-3-glycerol phosphate synthase TrpC [Acidimicrobiales bacterium]
MTTYLDSILEWHRERAKNDDRPVEALLERAREVPAARAFEAALRGAAGGAGAVAVIAEIKRRSPSKGQLAPQLQAVDLARAYEAGGASCLSILTDGVHFGGSPLDLIEARAATSVPVLRKDFTVCECDVADARLMGADAVLLIVAALEQAQLVDLLALAGELGIDALVECHDEAEVERAVDAGATMIGVNQRDLTTFEVDTARAERLARLLPDSVVKVAESGVDGPEACRRLAAAGFSAVLVGEHLVRSADPAAAVRSLTGA